MAEADNKLFYGFPSFKELRLLCYWIVLIYWRSCWISIKWVPSKYVLFCFYKTLMGWDTSPAAHYWLKVRISDLGILSTASNLSQTKDLLLVFKCFAKYFYTKNLWVMTGKCLIFILNSHTWVQLLAWGCLVNTAPYMFGFADWEIHFDWSWT